METMDIKVFNALGKEGVNGLTQSAIIYRVESASFIYACFHCGSMFDEINATLQHIESHFQLVNVMVDPTLPSHSQTVEGNEMNDKLAMTPKHENFDIKTEATDEFDDIPAAMTSTIQTMFSEDDQPKPVPRKQRGIKNEKPKKVKESSALKSNREKVTKHKEKPKKVKESSALKSNREKVTKHKEKPYRCHICSKVYRNASVLQNHLNRHTNAQLLRTNKCKKCDEYFESAAALRNHVLKVHLFRQTTEATPKRDLVRYEDKESFTEEQHSCEFCTQRFYIKSNLEVHLKTFHSGERRLQCSTCYAVFTAPRNYYAHQSEHKRVGANTKEFDEKAALASIEALIDERIAHQDGQPFCCLICDATAKTHYEIRAHIRNKHVHPMFPPPMERKKKYFCDYCGAQLKSKHALVTHFQIHTNTKKHPCRFCGKYFRMPHTRMRHERLHTGEKPFQCHECGKIFTSKSSMNIHKQTHEDTTYPCHICGKVFRRPNLQQKHVKTHRVERDYECTICGKTFNTQIYLSRHKEIHSDRKHKCHFCDSTFNTGDGRRQHQRHKHKYEMGVPM